jgi:hypothetical protein
MARAISRSSPALISLVSFIALTVKVIQLKRSWFDRESVATVLPSWFNDK